MTDDLLLILINVVVLMISVGSAVIISALSMRGLCLLLSMDRSGESSE
jgi:uncharacterized membrane protein